MEVLKSNRVITPIEHTDALRFDSGLVYLWVIHANKIPPHLGISQGTQFFSLKANGKDDALSVDKILPILERKNIATVFYRIKEDSLVFEPKEAFSRFERTIPEEITCLEPLKLLLNIPQATWLKELLYTLEERGSVTNAFGWQLPQEFEGVPDYDPKDIHKRLQELDNV